MATAHPAIETKKASLSIGGSHLLMDVSLRVEESEFVAIIGANGAGKTTLIKCLLGLLKPDAGTIHIMGQSIEKYNRRELAQRIAYVPQLLEASIPFTVLDFVIMGRYAHGGGFSGTDTESRDTAMESLRLAKMESFAGRTLNTLSGGERQKTCIAAALAQQTPILVLDEPSAHLDPRQREEVHELLASIGRNSGISILTITHDLNWASMDYDRIIGMSHGRVILDGPPETCMSTNKLRSVFKVDFNLYPHPETHKPMLIPSTRKEHRP